MLKLDKMETKADVFNKENFDLEAFNEVNFEGTIETFTVFVPTDVVNLSRVQDDYDYDMEASHNTFFWDELLPTLIVYCLTFVLGLVGNVLIIFTIFRYRKMKSTTNVFLASLASSDLLLILFCIPVKPSKQQQAEQTERSKSPKKDLLYLHLKPFLKPKTARDPPKSKDEIKRYRKPSDRMMKRRESGTNNWTQDAPLPIGEILQFNNAWEHTNFSIVPTVEVYRAKEHKGRERKRKRSQRVRKRNKSDLPADAKNSKNLELVLGGPDENAKIKVIHPSFDDFVKDRKSYMNESGGKAVVIYHRRNRRKYLHPHTGDGYQFEQIAFERSCEATVDTIQSKRSLSEPRQNSTKELFVARRRTRFQVEPHKMASTQSDFHSAIDFLKQSPGSIEFKKFEGIKSSLSTFLCQNPINKKCVQGKKYEDDSNQDKMVVTKSLSSTSTKVVGIRLKKTAQKKLDLHKEMIRAEKNNKKKFWESIQRSLNYRCALAEMFSSHSYVSSNESSKFFSSADNSTNRSTNIYVRESVISSYQGFSRFITSSKADPRNISKPTQLTQPYHSVKTVLDTLLIKEDEEEEEILLREHIDDGFTSQSSSNSTVHMPYDNRFHYASDKLSLIESTLGNSDTNSKLELLMARLSEEIRKCSQYMKKLNETAKKKVLNYSSASDSKIDLRKKSRDTLTEQKNAMGWGMEEQIVYPVFVYSASDILIDYPQTRLHRSKEEKSLQRIEKKENEKISEKEGVKSGRKPSEKVKKPGSNDSICSNTSEMSKVPSETRPKTPPQVYRNKFDGFQCCDDCKLLKKRIIRLEQDLEKIEKRMPLYPPEYQETIKDCLESLNVTSETFLKRLKSCAKLRYMDQNKKYKKEKQKTYKRSASAPGPVLHEYCTRPLYLRPSGSDCQLNVGMELTMENVDPVTGRRLSPPIKGNAKQEGNVQCRMVQNGKNPVLMMDTDFSYSPNTGMLFRKKRHSARENSSSELLIPVETGKRRPPSVGELKGGHKRPSKVFERPQLGNEYLQPEFEVQKPPKKIHRDLSPEARPYRVVQDEEPMKKSSSKWSKSRERSRKSDSRSDESLEIYSDSTRMRPESKESKQPKSKVLFMAERRHEKTGRVSSQIPIRRKTTPNPKAESVPCIGSATTFTILPMGLESSSLSSAVKSPEKSNKTEQTVKNCLSATEEFCCMEKSTQTYEKPGNPLGEPKEKVATVSVGIQGRSPMRHYGMQVGAKKCNEEVQVESIPPSGGRQGHGDVTGSKPQMLHAVRTPKATTTMNVAVQANTSKRKKNATSSIGLQTNLPTEESLRYINDLQIQKKVNMAIAELCFHLSQEKEQEGV